MDWPVFRLDELFDIARGGSPRPIKSYLTNDDDGVNWIKISDASASGKYITETKEKIRPEGISKSRLVRKGDFLLSNSMSFGRPYIMGTDGCIHDGWLVLSPKSDRMDQDFLFYLLGSPTVFSQFDRLAAGSTVRNLNISLVSGVKVPLPSLEEQKRIVAVLDEAFADIEKTQELTEQNLKNARELYDSYLHQMLSPKASGWKRYRLGELCVFENGDRGKNYPSRSNFVSEGIAFINAGHIDNGQLELNEMNYITEANFNRLGRGKVRKGDILFCLRGSLGKFAVIENEMRGAIASSLVILRPNSLLKGNLLLHYLRSKNCSDMIRKYAGGAAQPNLGAKDLAKFEICIPDQTEQEAVSKSLDKLLSYIDILEDVYREKFRSISILKTSILQQAFKFS